MGESKSGIRLFFAAQSKTPEAPEHIGKFQVLLLSSVYAIHAPAGTVGQENSQALPISTERIGPWRSARLPLPQEGRTDPN